MCLFMLKTGTFGCQCSKENFSWKCFFKCVTLPLAPVCLFKSLDKPYIQQVQLDQIEIQDDHTQLDVQFSLV